MQILKIHRATLKAAASKRGYSPTEYVKRLATICNGREVCAHRAYDKAGEAFFILSDSVRTPKS